MKQPKFIEVTDINGKNMSINIANIAMVCDNAGSGDANKIYLNIETNRSSIEILTS